MRRRLWIKKMKVRLDMTPFISDMQHMKYQFVADELSALQNEQDMPIEELLKMYGGASYNQPGTEDTDTKDKEEGEEEEKKEGDEETSKGETAEEETLEKGEPTKEISVPLLLAEVEAEEEPQFLSKGEKRSSSTPPPAKKARSELAKYGFLIFNCTFVIDFQP